MVEDLNYSRIMAFGARAKFVFAVAFLFSNSAYADTMTGRVVGGSDGDTLTLIDATNFQHTIRLAGIDSPEKAQPFGQVCKQSLSDLAYDRTVQINWNKLDRYGRAIGKVLVNGQDVNLEQIKRGCAWHYKQYQNEQALEDRLGYAKAQDKARAAKVGLWIEGGAIPPWEWRRQLK